MFFWKRKQWQTFGNIKVSHPSGCWRKFFMALTCWKWQDMSVARTISTTSALSSLNTHTYKNTHSSYSPHQKKIVLWSTNGTKLFSDFLWLVLRTAQRWEFIQQWKRMAPFGFQNNIPFYTIYSFLSITMWIFKLQQSISRQTFRVLINLKPLTYRPKRLM